jgi:hypothetical protein
MFDTMAAADSRFVNATQATSIDELHLGTDVSDVWKDALPPGIHSNVVLEQENFVLQLQQDSVVVVQAGGRWGSMKGIITLYLQRVPTQPTGFMLVSSVEALDPRDIFEDPELAKELKKQLVSSMYCSVITLVR